MAAERVRGVRSEPDLVQDPSGLLLGWRIVLSALQRGKRAQRTGGQADIER
jgi:hypothetical protein